MQMKKLRIAASTSVRKYIQTERQIIPIETTWPFDDIAAIVLSAEDLSPAYELIFEESNNIPSFAIVLAQEIVAMKEKYHRIEFFARENIDSSDFQKILAISADAYEENILPPFFKSLVHYVSNQNSTFACPGHQGTDFFKRHPAGRAFLDFFGETILRADVPHADPILGEILTHGGPPGDAQKYAATVFNADKTYFVLNGTSTSNKIVTTALLTPGELVLFDRNNHKSCYHGALLQSGGIPIYLETTRNELGMIGGIPSHCYDEKYLRERVAKIDPSRANKERPFRLAILQFGTYDGIVADAQLIIDRIGHLCDYILFDSAWLGYEQFISIMKDSSPLAIKPNENDPGIFVTQSVHKQLAGFSQASQIHKKDKHIKPQSRYCNHKRFNHAFMMHSSTSPFYPIFSSLDVNSKMHSAGWGERLWGSCMEDGVEVRKKIFSECEYVKPFVPPAVDGRLWQDYPTAEILGNSKFFSCSPAVSWHGFDGYAEQQYILDPGKLVLSTTESGLILNEGESFGLPASILAHYLRKNGLIPEKSELRIILFLLTPAINKKKIRTLVDHIVNFENHLRNDSPIELVFPGESFGRVGVRKDFTLKELCARIYSLYCKHSTDELLRDMFKEENFPEIAISPMQANMHMVKGNVDLIPLYKAQGKVAAEGALPYPPGMLCIAPGERWGGSVLDYFMAIEDLINEEPVFAPGMQGVYQQRDTNGRIRLYSHVVRME